ncbi:zinc metalloproteinase nas-14-like [Diadema antillarum]|uniref:zinc metalloproteinase nas-14-like n=1 Tax=Diadema antillarum TaxID=105358 RepID=UPI003A88C2FF
MASKFFLGLTYFLALFTSLLLGANGAGVNSADTTDDTPEVEAVLEGMMDILFENQDYDREGSKIGKHGHLIDGDIYVEDLEEHESKRKRRNALRDRESLWPGAAIPYVIDGYFTDKHKKRILDAMQRFHEMTCIRFRPRTIERDYILFTQSLGCWSMVGRTGGRQKISLSGTCRGSRGVIMHELMHAIGFRHEHNRPDRDGYIEIYWQNIKEGFTNNFRKYSNEHVQTLGTGYDFLSLMHYPLTAFSHDGNSVTIGPRYPTYQIGDVGHRDDFSHIDAYRINILYKCGRCEDTDPYYCPIWSMMGECTSNKEWMTKYCPFSCDRCTIALANGDGLACIDRTSNCKRWAKIGECERNPQYMLQNCRLSCKQCRAVNTETGEEEGLSCTDDNTLCYDWATLGECNSNAKFMKRHCRRSCHVCTGGEGRIIIDNGECRDRNPQCPTWAETTRCQVNVGYMEENCRLSCNWCPPEESCVDIDAGCEKWARAGHCLTNEEGLRERCQKSCGHCGEVEGFFSYFPNKNEFLYTYYLTVIFPAGTTAGPAGNRKM